MQYEIKQYRCGFTVTEPETGYEWSQLFSSLKTARDTIIIRSYMGKRSSQEVS